MEKDKDNMDNAEGMPAGDYNQANSSGTQATGFNDHPSVSRQNVFSRLLNALPRAYTAEYILLLIITLTLVMIAGSMFGTVIDYISNKPNPRFGGGFAYTASIATLASIAVLVPLFAILTRRTKSTELQVPSVGLTGWRRGALSVFLLAIALNAIGYGIAFFYDVFSWLASFGLGSDGKTIVWKSIVKHLFAFVLFATTAFLYAKDYRVSDSAMHQRWAKLHRYALAMVVILLSVVFIAVPLQAQRGTFIDQAIVNDLRSIKTKVLDYERDKQELPDELDDLKLSDEIKSRAKTFDYEYNKSGSSAYELCANFKTDTTEKDPGSGNILEQFSSGSSLYDYERDDDPSIHSKGKDCFKFQAIYSRYNSNTNSLYNNYEL